MTRISPLSSPLLLGFEEVERALDRLSKAAGDGYPPYNIERLPRTEKFGEILRITLAVAGFAEDELEVTSRKTSWSSAAGRTKSRSASICTAASPRGNSRRPSCSPRASKCSAPL